MGPRPGDLRGLFPKTRRKRRLYSGRSLERGGCTSISFSGLGFPEEGRKIAEPERGFGQQVLHPPVSTPFQAVRPGFDPVNIVRERHRWNGDDSRWKPTDDQRVGRLRVCRSATGPRPFFGGTAWPVGLDGEPSWARGNASRGEIPFGPRAPEPRVPRRIPFGRASTGWLGRFETAAGGIERTDFLGSRNTGKELHSDFRFEA